jgi:hypothetical protein
MEERLSSEKKTGRLRGWLIRMGLIPPPKGEARSDERVLSEEQRKAQQDLLWHQLRHPQDR